MKNEKAKVKIIPLGGVNEIGKNLTAIEYKNDIVVIDCGLKFPDEDMFGIDLVIPDITYLQKNIDTLAKESDPDSMDDKEFAKIYENLQSNISEHIMTEIPLPYEAK